MTNKVKPSVLLKDALDALAACEKSRKYKINMDVWYRPSRLDNKCSVCLAGSVMALRLNLPLVYQELPNRYSEVSPWLYSYETRNMLQALNYLRQGEILDAVYTLDIEDTQYQIPTTIPVVDYDVSPAEWRVDMENVVEVLEEAGL